MHNSKSLAQRDPALAALMGAESGADFGSEASFGADFGDWQNDYGMHGDFGNDFGADVANISPTPQAALSLFRNFQQQQAVTQARSAVLEPNRGSHVKVERYVFPMSTDLVLGTASTISLSEQPDVTIRPQRLIVNAPVPGFCTFSNIKVSNVSVNVGPGSLDAFFYNAGGQGVSLDCPTLSPAQRATITGNYTGLIPTGYSDDATFTLSVAFMGPATMAG
jgi:hypothetical protein